MEVKQPVDDAKANVSKRLEYITGELDRSNKVMLVAGCYGLISSSILEKADISVSTKPVIIVNLSSG
eukprot:4797157-Amphidinium_carterae.1